jgi:hypothetical protein
LPGEPSRFRIACESDEASVMCRVSMGPLYSTFRRSIAQLAGLLLLFRTAKTFELEAAVISLDVLEANVREALDALLSISPPKPIKKTDLPLRFSSTGI